MQVIVGCPRFFNRPLALADFWLLPRVYEATMATLMIDGRAHSGEKPLKTVGDLVAAADDWLARSGRIVTELRLDGVDEPAFREPQIVGQSASAYSEVRIESGTRADLALRCLHEAGDALKSLAEAAASVADLYRLGEIAEANRELAAITDGIGTALAITGAASLGLGVDLGTMATSEGTLGDLTAATSQELQGLISAQLESDWEGTADMLIGGLSPVLRRWSVACSVLAPPSPC